MNDCCISPAGAQSYIDWFHAMPPTPLDVIANASLGGTQGAFVNSSNFGTASSWVTTPIAVASPSPQVAALETTNAQMTADATQWNMSHLTADLVATMPSAITKIIFLRGGNQWQNNINLTLGGTPLTIQLGFRDALPTRGDAQGTWPVIQWTGVSGPQILSVTLNVTGRFIMGIRAFDGANTSLLESEWIVVP
jgi:hypothetical protein